MGKNKCSCCYKHSKKIMSVTLKIFVQFRYVPWHNTAHHFFNIHTVQLDNYQSFPPTDAQLDSLKNNFKFALKLTLESFYMFRCKTPSSESTLSEPC